MRNLYNCYNRVVLIAVVVAITMGPIISLSNSSLNSEYQNDPGDGQNQVNAVVETGSFTVSTGNINQYVNLVLQKQLSNPSGAPDGAEITKLEYGTRIYGQSDISFRCDNVSICLSSEGHGGPTEHCGPVYSNLGGLTDGGYDDDPENDLDIEIDNRTASSFLHYGNPNQIWYFCVSNFSDSGCYLEYANFRVSWQLEENLTSPNTPTGPDSGKVGESLTFETGGATSDLGHDVQYAFDWGEGNLVWGGSPSKSHTYMKAGTYYIRAWARCAEHTDLRSNSVTTKEVQITGHNLTLSVIGTGSVTADTNKTEYNHNETVLLTAEPSPDYHFDHWEGDLSGSTNPDSITMNGDKNVTAVFVSSEDPFVKIIDGDIVNDDGMSMGCAWADHDNDGYPDLYVTNTMETNFFYINNGDKTFTKSTSGEIINDVGVFYGPNWGDYDNDGDPDLFVCTAEGDAGDVNFLFNNHGDGTFSKFTQGDIVNDVGVSFGSSWGDYNNDGYLDLYVANFDNMSNFLYKNNGNGTFIKITEGEIVTDVASSTGCGWGDYDNDGDLDLYVTNYSDVSQNNALYQNNGDETFTKVTTGSIVQDGGQSAGCSWGDYDHDGDLDLFVANSYLQTNFLYTNNGNGTFNKVTAGEIIADAVNSIGSCWGDYDNDGDLDLYVSTYSGNNFLYVNEKDSAFTKETESVATTEGYNSSGCSWADFDNDGDLDLYVANFDGVNNSFFMNVGNTNHWINIQCIGRTSNRSAIGAKVRVKSTIQTQPIWQMHEIAGQTGHCGQNSLNAEFGLGDAAIIDSITIEWPSGIVQVLIDVNVDTFLTIIENRFPIVQEAITDTTITINDTLIIDLIDTFNDPDGDTLTYSVSSSVDTAAVVTIEGSILTVLPKDTGITTIRVTASDGKGGSAETEFKVSVDTDIGANQPPIVAHAISDTTLILGVDTLIVDLEAEPSVFNDPDGDVLTYFAISSANEVAVAALLRSTLTVVPLDTGTATITITARDEHMDSVSSSFIIDIISEIIINNPPTVVNTIPDTNLTLGDYLLMDLEGENIFDDADGDVLSYSAVSSADSVVTITIVGPFLNITPVDTGTTTITITAKDAAGDSASTTFNINVYSEPNQPPEINHIHIISWPEGQEMSIMAYISEDRGIVDVVLTFRCGGDVGFTSTVMTLVSSTYQTIIADSLVTSCGMEYFIETTDTDGETDREPVSGSISVQVNVAEPGVLKESTQPAGSEQTAYRLFSVPLQVDHNTVDDILIDDLGSYDKTRWRFFELLEDQTVVENPSTSPMEPGFSFWLIVKEAGKMFDTGSGKSNSICEEYSVALHSNWNFVANPFNFPIPLGNLRLKSGEPFELRHFTGTWNDPDSVQVAEIDPFEGYALFSSISSDTLFVNPDCSVPLAKNLKPVEDRLWAIHISAQCQEARDVDNAAIVSKTALKGYDPMDHPEPPPVGDFVSVYFPHPEWETLAQSFCRDARPMSEEGEMWTIGIRSSIRDKVELTFEGLESVPKTFEVWLVDERLNIKHNLLTDSRYTLTGFPSEYAKNLKLYAGVQSYCEEKLAEIDRVPKTFTLFQNYPNPFNPTTTIRYGLPKAGKVTLKIYNLMGEEVKTLLISEIKEAGYHVVIWDGRTDRGNPAAAGLYFIRMRVDGFTQTRKMVLVE